MKINKIFRFASLAVASATLMGVTSCNYLDVVPPEQPGLSDATKNHTTSEAFLYSCYHGMMQREFAPRDYRSCLNSANDEFLIPEIWYSIDSPSSYAIMRNTQTTSATGYDPGFWTWFYEAIGQTLLFDREIANAYERDNNVNNVCVDDTEYKMWRAESRFCRAYYHFQLLRLYGPIPITNSLVSMDVSMGAYPGRSHFDACVDWIVNELDEAAKDLPDGKRDAAQLGRATPMICAAVKARVLLYAASPLWNGEFPTAYRNWKNTNYTTEGTNRYTGEPYGRELVDRQFHPEKWQRALKACSEALQKAEEEGYTLYNPTIDDEKDQIDADVAPGDIRIPGLDELTAKMQELNFTFKDAEGEDAPFDADEFKKAVYKLRYLHTTTVNEGNTEIIWADSSPYYYDPIYGYHDSRLPRRVLQTTSNQTWKEGWNGVSPTLYTVEHFLNADGTVPGTSTSVNFNSQSGQFYKDGHLGKDADGVDRSRVTNICLNREPRFYAFIGFDGGDYLTNLKDGEPCVLNMRDPEQQGRGQGERNYSVTGFLSMKHVDPLCKWDGTNGNWTEGTKSPHVLIRLSELLLNVAECEAYMSEHGITPDAEDAINAGKSAEALKSDAIAKINQIRNRAYVGPLTEGMIGTIETRTSDNKQKTWTLTEWVRNERFVELWDEGHRYFDVRRWAAGEEYFGYGKRRGLNGLAINPGSTFTTPMLINSQYTFHYRQYLYPILVEQVYKNPQMVQNPGF